MNKGKEIDHLEMIPAAVQGECGIRSFGSFLLCAWISFLPSPDLSAHQRRSFLVGIETGICFKRKHFLSGISESEPHERWMRI